MWAGAGAHVAPKMSRTNRCFWLIRFFSNIDFLKCSLANWTMQDTNCNCKSGEQTLYTMKYFYLDTFQGTTNHIQLWNSHQKKTTTKKKQSKFPLYRTVLVVSWQLEFCVDPPWLLASCWGNITDEHPQPASFISERPIAGNRYSLNRSWKG